MRYYISGPMTGHEDANYRYFTKVCEILRKYEYNIFSPHEIPIQQSYEDCIKIDIRLLTSCDAIIMLPGWVFSKGAMLEFQVAVGLSLPVYFYNDMAELKSHILLEMGHR